MPCSMLNVKTVIFINLKTKEEMKLFRIKESQSQLEPFKFKI